MAGEVKPIRTKRDYEAALKEVERLWGAKSGTRDGDRLDVLATLIDAYEAEHYPMDPPDPIEAIKFRMEQQGLTRRDLERDGVKFGHIRRWRSNWRIRPVRRCRGSER